ncbi:hypothetical protein LZZ85_23120 [Terrimonas sp. NA20]|uniref:Lipoprotein n=1 Tax=Terrimonas ginsenosidimutans TaxID=2908004 RepID=A0ABS9KY15_9BACT|nr:hypothetical protein [Terrimonas ginsenosidimutans]MCG2617206.1 hypothetical protein [Terrimonas ginsenosidimutans]
MRRILSLFAGSLFFLSCNNSAPVKEAKEEAKDTAAAQPLPTEVDIAFVQKDSTIHLVLKGGGIDSVSGKGHIDKKGTPVICYLDLDKGNKLTGKVIPDKAGANIRFSHIYMPDGSSDGPFGQTIEYTAKQKGTYRLYVSPNMMAGDPESTDFVVTVVVR